MKKTISNILWLIAVVAIAAYGYFWHYLPTCAYKGEFEDTVAVVADYILQSGMANNTQVLLCDDTEMLSDLNYILEHFDDIIEILQREFPSNISKLQSDVAALQDIIDTQMSPRTSIKLLRERFPKASYEVIDRHRSLTAQAKRSFGLTNEQLRIQLGESYQKLAELGQTQAKCIAQADEWKKQANAYQTISEKFEELARIMRQSAKDAKDDAEINRELADISIDLSITISNLGYLLRKEKEAQNNEKKFKNAEVFFNNMVEEAQLKKHIVLIQSDSYQHLADFLRCVKDAGRVAKNYSEATQWYTKAAEKGHLKSQITLWKWYSEGENVEQDLVTAAEWMIKAAEQNDLESQITLWKWYQEGKGVDKNMTEAAKWMTNAAEKGDMESQYTLATLYETGDGVTADIKTSAKWHLKAAEQKHTPSQAWMGYHYYVGTGVDQDYAEAVKWLTRASEENEVYSTVYLGVCYLRGEGVASNNLQAFKLFDKAKEIGLPDDLAAVYYLLGYLGYYYDVWHNNKQTFDEIFYHFKTASDKGIIEAQFSLAHLYEFGLGCKKNFDETIRCYKACSDKGIVAAKFFLANCYFFGTGAQNKPNEAFSLYHDLAKQGIAEAQFDLGYCYFYGRGTALEPTKGVEWYIKAAANGNTQAKLELGNYYFYGNHIQQNLQEAAKWYQQAAEEGNPEAQLQLGYCYLNGDGVDVSTSDAKKWFSKAYDNGIKEAKELVTLCYDETKELVADLVTTHYDNKQNSQRTARVKDSILLWCDKHAPILTYGNIEVQHNLIVDFKYELNKQYNCKYATQADAYRTFNIKTEQELKNIATATIDAEKEFQVDFDKVRTDELANIKEKYPLYKPGQYVQISFKKANMVCNYSGTYKPGGSERMMIGSRFVRYSDLPDELLPRFSKQLNEKIVNQEINDYMMSYKLRFDKKRSDEINAEHLRLMRAQSKLLLSSGMIWVSENNLQWRTPAELVEPTLTSWRKEHTISKQDTLTAEEKRRAKIIFPKEMTRPTQCSVANPILANVILAL